MKKRILSVAFVIMMMLGSVGIGAIVGNVQVKVVSAASLQEEIQAPQIAAKEGLVKENGYYRYYKNGKLLKNKWKKIDGRKYYFKSNGNAATLSYKIEGKYYVFNRQGKLLNPSKAKIVTVGDRKFYVNQNGQPIKGWLIYKNKLYHVSKRGRCASDTTIDGITFTKDCWAKNNTNAKLKMEVMKLVDKLTTKKMSGEEKLRVCFQYTISGTFHYNRAKWPNFHLKQWWKAAGLDMLTTKQGVCFGYACAFAALAKELGYTPYLIDATLAPYSSRHCWVRIDGKFYDRLTGICGVAPYPRSYTVNQIIKF